MNWVSCGLFHVYRNLILKHLPLRVDYTIIEFSIVISFNMMFINLY
jgi:hypothetical protein